MRKAVLIYNPAAGRKRKRREHDVEVAAQVLRASGVEVTAVPTRAAGSAGWQAQEAIERGCDTVIAGGGDGTVHEVLQGVMAHPDRAALGCIPLGTGNVLANDLGIPRTPAAAARKLLSFHPGMVAAGRVEFQPSDAAAAATRYFAVMAGVGVDAQLPYSLAQNFKDRYGMAGYIAQGLKIYLKHDFPLFEVEFTDSTTAQPRREKVSLAFAVRVSNFGGFMRRFVPAAGLKRDDVQVLLVKTRNGHRLAQYMVLAAVGLYPKIPGLELVHVRELACRSLNSAEPGNGAPLKPGERKRIYTQADGELLGFLPVRITVIPKAFSLLMPRRAAAFSGGS